jgi:hypothetical protein
MRLIVAGSRTFTDYARLSAVLDRLLGTKVPEIVSGGARGTDALGERYAREHGLKLTVMPADWETNGKAAGPIRNRQMAEYGTHLVAFWDGASPGTKHMIDAALDRGLSVRVVRLDAAPKQPA